MPRPPKNHAESKQSIRISKDLRDTFKRSAEERGESAASRIRWLMYHDLPIEDQLKLEKPVKVHYIKQDFRKDTSEGRSGGSEQE